MTPGPRTHILPASWPWAWQEPAPSGGGGGDPALAGITPAQCGVIAWTGPPLHMVGSTAVNISTREVHRFSSFQGGTATSVWFRVNTVNATNPATDFWIAVYTDDGSQLLGASANLGTNGSNQVGTIGIVQAALTTPAELAPGTCYRLTVTNSTGISPGLNRVLFTSGVVYPFPGPLSLLAVAPSFSTTAGAGVSTVPPPPSIAPLTGNTGIMTLMATLS